MAIIGKVNLVQRPADLIFPERQVALGEQRCMPKPIGCGEKITGFSDALSEKEYGITCLCQKCQDIIYAESNEGDLL
jgi:hypothetical protein